MANKAREKLANKRSKKGYAKQAQSNKLLELLRFQETIMQWIIVYNYL